MPTTISRIGFGQVEPNHLSAQRTGQIYAQLPANKSIEVLENGQFVKYDYATGEVNTTGKGEWMLVFNEVKLYDERNQRRKDYAMLKKDFTPGSEDIDHYGMGPLKGQMVPRVLKTNVGDIYTTNCLGVANTSATAKVGSVSVDKGDVLKVDETGFLVADPSSKSNPEQSAEPMLWQVAKVYTMPDGQSGVKIMRIK